MCLDLVLLDFLACLAWALVDLLLLFILCLFLINLTAATSAAALAWLGKIIERKSVCSASEANSNSAYPPAWVK